MICPNISLKEVKDGFNEMVEALGGRPLTDEEFKSSELRNQRTGQDYSAMEAAYRTYHRNNGNMLDKAPNGNDSVLFNSLLEHFGNRTEAIKAKVNVYTNEFFNWFGDWTQEDKENVSKVVDENGEPLVVWHSGNDTYSIFNLDKSPNGFYFGTQEQAFARADMEVDYVPNGMLIQTFLNIRNPKITTFDDRDINKYKATNDGFIIKVSEEDAKELASIGGYNPDNFKVEYVAFNPNQIKHVENLGAWSTEDNNIYHNLTPASVADEIRKNLTDRGIIHSFKGYRLTKSVMNAEQLVCQACEGTPVIPFFYRDSNSTAVEFLDNVTIADDLRDEIERTNNKSTSDVLSLARTLQNKVPQLSFEFIRPTELPEGVDKRANSFVKGNKVYLVVGRATTESTVEEFMHPIVYTIQNLNDTLFNSLFEEAKKDFPKLWAEIQDTYTDKRGFNNISRQNELVTQALSRYVHSGYKKAQNRTTVKELVRNALNYIAQIINRAIEMVGGKAVVTPENLPKMKLEELARLIVADDSQFRVWTTEEIQHSISTKQQKAQKVAEQITERFYVLYRAYERMPNKSPRRQQIQNQIFEKFNELKQTQDYYAVTIALDFALQNLGTWDYTINEPMKADSVSGYLWKQSKLADPYSDITPERLVEMYQNSIGFYDNLVSQHIPNNLDDQMSAEDK